MEIDNQILEKIKLLDEKYKASGQDLNAYLEGLLYAEYLTYWDYVQVDTLLSLQHPRTSFPDEKIFILYHQITELYFNLCLHELEQLTKAKSVDVDFFIARIKRVNKYFEALTFSFDVMIEGMEQKQFLQFRMSLLPASGFQSAQYRTIEIFATDFINLVAKDKRNELRNSSVADQYEHIYWKNGATELGSGKKTLTLLQFEQKYDNKLNKLANELHQNNIYSIYQKFSKEDQIKAANALKNFDVNVNINWPLCHYKSAVRYLQRNPEDIAATGGTNWQKYLPPRFQKRIFYPELWTENEIENWGKAWVETNVFNQQ
jgi:tryptophan 2,3-dioxygenase